MTTMIENGSLAPRTFAVDSSTEIEAGDLIFEETDDARPASTLPWNTDLAGTQGDFQDKFVGVSGQRSRDGDTDEVRVVKDGVWEFDCDAAQFEVGDFVGPADSGSSTLTNQKVVAVADETLAIGRVSKRATSNVTKVSVRVFTNN